jgi:hypothetical protein
MITDSATATSRRIYFEMPKELFIDRKFSEARLAMVNYANTIIREYQTQGFTLTLRQLYYQFVSRDLLPNKQSEYKRLGSVINDARLAGLIDWDAIEDRTRNLKSESFWSSPNEILESAAYGYRANIWESQDYYIEVWLEKEAVVGVIEPVCRRWRTPYFACRGYSSQSEQWRAGKRFAQMIRFGKRVLVLHLGDHDPSGIDMSRDNDERLAMFARYSMNLELKRIALNMNQVEQYNPPPNPAKMTDIRFGGYAAAYGDESWELDALSPVVIWCPVKSRRSSARCSPATTTRSHS